MYASVEDLRAEGVTTTMASDERASALLAESSALIDRVTGWWFEPRNATLRLYGRDTPSIEPPVPPLRLDALLLGDEPVSVAEDVEIVGAPVAPSFDAPRITRRHGLFPRDQEIRAIGLWGFTEADGTPLGRTPLAIRRATLLLTIRCLPKLADADGMAARSGWRLLEEKTRDQSYRLQPLATPSLAMTMDPEVDQILARYRRPAGLGAA